MFAEWVARGAGIGVTAFFAVVVFAGLAAAALGLIGALIAMVRRDDENDIRGR